MRYCGRNSKRYFVAVADDQMFKAIPIKTLVRIGLFTTVVKPHDQRVSISLFSPFMSQLSTTCFNIFNSQSGRQGPFLSCIKLNKKHFAFNNVKVSQDREPDVY